MYFTLALIASAVFPLWIMKKGIELKNPPYMVVLVGLIYSVSGALLVLGGASIMGVDLSGQTFAESAVKNLLSNEDVLNQLGMGELSKEMQKENLITYYLNMYMFVPTCFFVWGAIISYLEYRFMVKRKIRKGFVAEKMIPVEEFNLPRNAGLSWLLLYVVASIISSGDFEYGRMIYVNIFALMQLTFAYQGISFICYFLKMKRLPKAIGIIVGVLLIMTGKGIYVLFLLGFTDLCFALKGRIKGK